MKSVLEIAAAWHLAGEDVALATIVETAGSTPRPAGSRMVISKSGKIAGSVCGGCIEAMVAEAALTALQTGAPALLDFGMANETPWAVGLSCQGRVKIFVEPLG